RKAGEMGRMTPCAAGFGRRREGARADARPLSRVGEGRSGACQTDLAPPRHDELLRRVGGHHPRRDRREAARRRARPEERNVIMSPDPRARRFLDPVVVARLGTLELRSLTIDDGILSGLHRCLFIGSSDSIASYSLYN